MKSREEFSKSHIKENYSAIHLQYVVVLMSHQAHGHLIQSLDLFDQSNKKTKQQEQEQPNKFQRPCVLGFLCSGLLFICHPVSFKIVQTIDNSPHLQCLSFFHYKKMPLDSNRSFNASFGMPLKFLSHSELFLPEIQLLEGSQTISSWAQSFPSVWES